MASVRRRDPHDSTSSWVVDYIDPHGRRRRVTPKSGLRRDAEKIRHQVERAAHAV